MYARTLDSTPVLKLVVSAGVRNHKRCGLRPVIRVWLSLYMVGLIGLGGAPV